ncbi:hypothetical protein C0993_002122, partial [Termitomyces sp. T159_Od127]
PEPGTPLRVVEVAIRPSERTSLIKEAVESALNRQKEIDHHWEDQVDSTSSPPKPMAGPFSKADASLARFAPVLVVVVVY